MSNYNNLYIIPIDPSVELIVSLRLRLRAISSRTERNSLLSAELGPSYEPEMHNNLLLYVMKYLISWNFINNLDGCLSEIHFIL